jgi:hypothetical protein
MTIASCKKGDDFIDSTSQFPFGWKSTDSFNIITYNQLDTIGNIVNMGTSPLGTVIDANFGKMQTGFFANFQTTLSSTSFSFVSIDSAVLVLPYFTAIPKYGKVDQPLDIYVYEVTEDIESSSSSKRMNYAYNPTVVGSRLSYTVNTTDSVQDGTGKSAPSIRISLSLALANKLIAKGTYIDDIDFQTVFKGLYVKPGANSTNGFVMIGLNSDLRIKIYGKNSSNMAITSEFITGNTRSTTVNQFSHDATSTAYSASAAANKITGDAKLYNCGIFGYYTQIQIPDISTFAVNKEIFKAELTFYSLDTGFIASSDLGIMYIDSARGGEVSLLDDYYNLNHKVSIKDTIIQGTPTRRFVYNIGMHLTSILVRTVKNNKFNLYSAPLISNSSTTSKLSNFLPSRIVLAGNMQPLTPKLTLYYINK